MNFGVTYGNATGITGDTDSSYGDDQGNGRSTSGYLFQLNGGAVTWSSRQQGLVTTSTCDEAEYVGLTEAAKEAIWLGNLLEDLGVSMQPITLLCDNSGSIALAQNTRTTGRTKHFTIRHHFIRDDALTKPVSAELLYKFCKDNFISF